MSHNLNQWRLVYWRIYALLGLNVLNKKFNQNQVVFIQETAFEKVVCKMAAILFRLNVLRVSLQNNWTQ